jgi:hypothetical protein
LIAINNDVKSSRFEIPVAEVGLANGVVLKDRLGASHDVRVNNGKVMVELPARSSSIFVRR